MPEAHVEPHDARGLAQLLAEAEEAFRQVEEDALADLDLRPWMLRVLDLLEREGPQTPSDVARALRVSQPTVSGWIAEMTGRGLIERLRDEGDGRRATIRLTEHGASSALDGRRPGAPASAAAGQRHRPGRAGRGGGGAAARDRRVARSVTRT